MEQAIQAGGLAGKMARTVLNWPEQRPRRGLIISSWQEIISFDEYSISDEILFLNRPQPDSVGARKVMILFSHILAVKFTDVFEFDEFSSLGFQ